MREEILEFLRRNDSYTSGEEISEHLKISRQALWKHIQELRDAGYDIVAIPHLGYKLASVPDRLFPGEISRNLGTTLLGKKIFYFDTVASTMDVASTLAATENAPEGTLVLAEAQTRGRGRLGRVWSSPKYKGIYFSFILRPRIPPERSPLITLMVGVSICEAIQEAVGLEARIKWPNDILIENKKVGGILTELSAEQDMVRFIIVGAGLNVNNDERYLVDGATSLCRHTKEDLNRVYIAQELVRRIETNYLRFKKEGGAFIIERWRALTLTLGRRVKILYQKKSCEGMAVDIDADGGLLIRTDSGVMDKVMAGDIVHCR